jgi:hypothetical protein
MTRNIGIGIDPGTVKLRITVGNAGEWTMRTNGSTTAGQSFGFLLDAGTNASDATLQLRSATGAATHMFVRGDGHVGIGTASPSAKLEVPFTGSLAGMRIQISSANYFNATNHFFRTLGDNNLVQISGSYIDASFQANYGLRLPATPGATGAGSEQTLDCYAEGTWTPTVTGFGGTAPTVTGRYTRVGRLVTLSVLVSATGGAQFSSTANTTYISLPSGMTPTTASQPGATSNSGIAADGPCVAYTNGNLYLPTFALRTADTFLTVTYMI